MAMEDDRCIVSGTEKHACVDEFKATVENVKDELLELFDSFFDIFDSLLVVINQKNERIRLLSNQE